MNALVKSHCRSFVVCILLCSRLFASAQQLSANFTATPQSGCSPLIVHFTDQSTGNPSQWKWDLGNGASSTLQNPSATYFNPGTYTIKLVVKNAASIDSTIKIQYITVYANPVAQFSAPDTSGCFPLPVQFSDNSFSNGGNISSWQWDFGDGTVSSQQNPAHTYSAAGNYSVTLHITSNFGCTKTITKAQYIKVSSGVTADFTNTTPVTCSAPVTVQFTNISTGPGSLSYQWNFGDGSTATSGSPSHNYVANGSYTVSLIATSPQGCKDTIEKVNLLFVGHQADFTIPITACVNEIVSINNTSAPAPTGSAWYFNDGTSSTALQPSKSFTTPGNYTIKLVSSFGSCIDSTSKQIVVAAKPHASFTAGKTDFCKTPSTVQFTSPNSGAMVWNFGDGSTSNQSNPSHTYTSEGNFTVTLIVTNNNGCSDTLTKANYINIKKPVIQLHGIPQTGCVPISTNFSATVTCSEPVQTWLWNFGDGSSSNLPNPSYLYPNAGTYAVSLLITTPGGCIDSVAVDNAVRGGKKPIANFYSLNTTVCNESPVVFIDSSYADVDEWHWDFGDSLTSTQQNPSHVFAGLGSYSITLIASSNTCSDTITKINYVTILPPTAGLTVQNSCSNKYTKVFTGVSQTGVSWLWNFGDGSTSTIQNPTHTYAVPGNYYVTLSVTNGNCSNFNFLWVKVVDEDPAISTTNVSCKNVSHSFSTPLVNNNNISSWSWDFGDGNTSTQPAPLSHAYTNSGTYFVQLTVTDILGCITTTNDTVQVFGAVAQFQPNVSTACLDGNHISFVNSSYADGQNNLTQWIWNYGDGNIQANTTPSSTSHHYNAAGQYTVSLTVKDAWGCKDSTSFSPLIISQPTADFYSPDSASCTGKSITFVNQSAGNNLQYNWSFGDGAYSNVIAPTHQYNTTGLYPVTLSVIDQYGCGDSITKSNYIDISFPHAQFTVSDSIGNCPPLLVNFTNTSTNYSHVIWTFGDGSSSSISSPSHYYTTAGIFYAKLIVTGPGGCTDTAIQKIVVKGPSGTISYSPLAGCNPLTVNFTVSAQNSSSYVWDFSDGATQSSTLATISHTYTSLGDFIPKIILTDANGCNVPIVGSDTIRTFGATADFLSDLTRLCDHGNVQFLSNSISNDLITGYQWNFGDGGSSTLATPLHYFDSLGVYNVTLIVTTAHGCVDTFVKNPSVTVWQKPEIKIVGDTTGCIPATMNVDGVITKGPATLAWQWNFGNNQSAFTQHPAAQVYPVEGNYTLTAIAVAPFGCSDTATQQIHIHPLPETNAGADVSVCQGGAVQLTAAGAATYNWSSASTLSCATCPVTLASPSNNTMYVLTGTSEFGCVKKDTVNVTVHQELKLKVGAGDTICTGGKVNLTASGAETYTWYPSYNIQNPASASTTATPVTSTTYHVIGRDSHNCFSDTADVFIKVYPIPTVNAGADQELIVGDVLLLKATSSQDVTAWQWSSPGTLSCATCATTLAKPKQTTTYTVQVKNDGGCTAQDQVTVTVICNNGNLFIPNSFSPNGDGVNDKFYPSGRGINMIKMLRVYNRWGEVVFEKMNFSANDAAAGWDGMFKGQVLAPDVYVYACDVICQNNEVLSFKGDVTLLR